MQKAVRTDCLSLEISILRGLKVYLFYTKINKAEAFIGCICQQVINLLLRINLNKYYVPVSSFLTEGFNKYR